MVNADGYPQVTVRFFQSVKMEIKGNKGLDTIIAETQFKASVKARDGDYLYEYPVYKRPEQSYIFVYPRRVDFVVCLHDETGQPMYRSFTGVELKATISDLKASYGKNFRAFCYNYLLIPECIVARAERYMNEIQEYSHVGIIVLCGDGSVLIKKRAEIVLDGAEFDVSYNAAIEESNDEIVDTVWHIFGADT